MFERKRRKLWRKQEQRRIGITGVSRGTGTTFCTLMMAYFAKQVLKERTAIAERNCSGHLCRLGQGNKLFSIKGIDIWAGQEEILEKEYSYLFLDYGAKIIQNCKNMPEFSDCSVKIVTANLCVWKQEELFRFIESCSDMPGNEEWIYLIPFASSGAVKKVEKQIHRRIYTVAAEKEWYHMSFENLVLWKEILDFPTLQNKKLL